MKCRWPIPVVTEFLFFAHCAGQRFELSVRHLQSPLFRLGNKAILNLGGNFAEPLLGAVCPITRLV
jgi:hypothetical protein